jgi:signal transduction histidine kinase
MESAPKWAPRRLTISFFTLAVVIGVLLISHRILQMERDVRRAIAIELEQGLPPILADSTQVEQILLNLVTNAAEATPEPGGPITVRTGISDPEDTSENEVLGDQLSTQIHVYLEIEDEGCGLDEATRARMFDPFFSTKSTGRGLGLSTILGIVKTHKGSLLVQSQPGEGTRFRVGFPTLQTGDVPNSSLQDPVVSG